jgi:hypothetical protein
MLRIFREAGFRVEVQNVERWSELPMARRKLAPEYRGMPTEELLIKGFDVVLRPA